MKYCFLRYPGGRFKAVTLSYDDGKSSDINLADIINSYGIKATFNINSCAIGCAGRLTEEEIKKYIIKRGHEIAIHGKNHIAPGIGKPEMVISDIIESFCKQISFKEDTWYATNMEIYEYVKAYNELVMSADGSKIYNPTLKEIWMDIDGKRHTIKPDETINI